MTHSARPDLRVYPELESLSRAAAEALVALAKASIAEKHRFTVALSGGNTPRTLHRLLATDYRHHIPWPHVHVFWGDERYVSHDNPRSDYRMARETLLDHVPIPPENVHPMPTDFPDPKEAAAAYQEMLRSHFPGRWPRFDLILLGLGPDGHTASLFPNNPGLEERTRWVIAVRADADPPLRLTLTLPAINHAANIHFLVAGKGKAPALRRTLAENANPKHSPASAVKPNDGQLIWWVDQAARSL